MSSSEIGISLDGRDSFGFIFLFFNEKLEKFKEANQKKERKAKHMAIAHSECLKLCTLTVWHFLLDCAAQDLLKEISLIKKKKKSNKKLILKNLFISNQKISLKTHKLKNSLSFNYQKERKRENRNRKETNTEGRERRERMQRNTPVAVRKPRTSTSDLLTWSEAPPPSSAAPPVVPRSRQVLIVIISRRFLFSLVVFLSFIHLVIQPFSLLVSCLFAKLSN